LTEPQLIANSIYHGLQLSAEKKYSNGLQLLATFVWSKSIDDSSQADWNVSWLGSIDSLQDPNKPWLERSLSTFDIPYVFQFSYSYDLPVGHGRAFMGNMPRWADLILGGWKTNGIWRIADGRPLTFNLTDGGQPLPTYGDQRPNIVGTPKRNHGSDWVDNYFVDPNVFQRPAPHTLGDAPRALGAVRSPSHFTTDLSVGKEFPIGEQMNFEFRVEARNAIKPEPLSIYSAGGLLLHRDRHLLRIYAALIVLRSDGDNACAGCKRPNEMAKFVPGEDRSCRLSVDHHDRSRISRTVDLDDTSVLHDRGHV